MPETTHDEVSETMTEPEALRARNDEMARALAEKDQLIAKLVNEHDFAVNALERYQAGDKAEAERLDAERRKLAKKKS